MKKSKSKKKIAVITTTRADYGLLKNLITKFDKSKYISCKLIVCGTHNLKKFGKTIEEINKDGLKISEVLKVNLNEDRKYDVSNFFLQTGKKFNHYLKRNHLDGILVLGDRYEILSVASIAKIYNIPIIHLHGGESTYALIDESIRHAITKLSCLHFTSHKKYKLRLEKMGESPKSVFSFGGLGASRISKIKLKNKLYLQKVLKIDLSKKYFLVTFHPVTLENNKTKKEFLNLLKALSKIKNVEIIFTSPNAEVNYLFIKRHINKFLKKNKNSFYFESLGAELYYSLMKYSSGVVGNSSSGILEAPSFKIPTINIGNRQEGRLQAASIINCEGKVSLIKSSLNKALSKKFLKSIKFTKNLYYQKSTEEKILSVIEKVNLKNLNKKKFYEKN